jgi:hypothetical protein
MYKETALIVFEPTAKASGRKRLGDAFVYHFKAATLEGTGDMVKAQLIL